MVDRETGEYECHQSINGLRHQRVKGATTKKSTIIETRQGLPLQPCDENLKFSSLHSVVNAITSLAIDDGVRETQDLRIAVTRVTQDPQNLSSGKYYCLLF